MRDPFDNGSVISVVLKTAKESNVYRISATAKDLKLGKEIYSKIQYLAIEALI